MYRLILLALLCVFTGCNKSQAIDRATFDQLYKQTALADNVISYVPLHIRQGSAYPRVVNWHYAGTGKAGHLLVFRELSLNLDTPVKHEERYTIDPLQLKILKPFKQTHDQSRWVFLHEAAPGEITPPRNVLTGRHVPGFSSDPVEVSPNQIEPRRVEPEPAGP